MAYDQAVRDKVRSAFVFQRLSLELAAVAAGVPISTARRWKSDAKKAGDDWDKAQAAQLMAGGTIEDIARQMLAGLVLQYQASMESLQTDTSLKPADKVQLLASLADAYNKTIAASKRILPETSELATAMDVLQRLAAYVKEHHGDLVAPFAQMLDGFGQQLARAYG
ncbi:MULTISPECIES: DUF1804 family protein [Ralstonia solanacearum species complex]|uniref:DNA binding protein n=1 Tax=Ralstonia phage RS138 TaxID=1483485 RepID=UPI0006BD3964|nr:DUF1804 family protein [Ralstonia solanacearum]YP_009226535.1 DNA binding protein [Ralstonia phage RS138]BEU73988.1 DUF1804 family protein [Ralstonia pseudosolanacearum]AXV78898.1 DNA-binding protein [Ralstonia solanacearum]AXV92920.1 DNA-binding protein [Ralstonia solanacearum]AXW20982.1 DNA-binding protein [Ralstonia solanacearum]AXW77818.1 DNA-binding protein [Ralstonia solanacearum]